MAGDSFLEVVDSPARCLGCDSPRTSPALGWLSPRISFSSSFAELDTEPRISREDNDAISTDFEFSMAMSNLDSVSAGIMLSADELFHNGKLIPLQLSPQLRMIESQSHAPNHKEKSESPKISSHQSIQPAEEDSPSLHRPSSNVCSSLPGASGLFAPPSPETPKCSIMLRDLFGANKGQPNSSREGSGKLMVPTKIWKHLVRGVTNGGKKGAVTSSISENPLKVSPASDVKANKITSSPASASLPSVSSRFSSSALMCERQQEALNRYENGHAKSEHCTPHGSAHALRLELESLENLLSAGKTLMTRPVDRSGATSADDCNMLHSRRKARSGRSVSVPSSSWSSPERDSGKGNTERFLLRGAEKFATGSSGKVNSGRIIMKNLERCSSNQKAPVKFQDHCNGMQHREYWRAQEKVSSYTSNVRVTPVYNVPVSLTPSVKTNKLAKGRFSSFRELFSVKKET
ncbi:hypothetical protein O6H91_04G062300 [Diphasiastrum complanatum]|uniref:Uncharacterized protein n=1 Tax=Diphasiastrum complanatum TaxID=34168 RepID=A0ACC2DXG6_DIPCM|nr:hypothetical protein O6H91_04G062300 [Diphasiastrum complanatum]